MSNEYYDWLRDRAEESEEWVEKYPFLRFRDNGCWMFDLPVGWQNGFGEQMCDELMNVLGKYVNDFMIVQLKEKFSSLRLYWDWVDREYTDEEREEMNKIYYEVEKIIRKYEEISYNTCSVCGKRATKWINSWILGYCDDCYERFR